MTTPTQTPTNLTAWIAELPLRSDWGAWDGVGNSVLEGVQNWSLKGDPSTAIGVWGNVVETESYELEGETEYSVNWCVYVGDCVDPQVSGLESAEDAMDRAERLFPEMF